MKGDVAWVPIETLRGFSADVFRSVGVPSDDANVCADVLLASDTFGIESHGVSRLKPIYYDRIKAGKQNPITNFEVKREGPTTALVDGHRGMGQVIGARAMSLAVEKARRYGMGMVAVTNSTHYGIAGYYARIAVDAMMIGVTGTNARPAMAPTFGTENMLGTNPLTFGMPSDEPFPFVYDGATTIIQRGKVEVHARTGTPLHEGLVIGPDGESMTDPATILSALDRGGAALLPLGGFEETGGYKGYGYATVVEVLCAALQGGPFLKALTGVNLGHFFIAVDISAFTELDAFRRTTGDILRALRASRKAPGHDRIYTAGEKAYLYSLERTRTGVPIVPSLQAELLQMRDECGLRQYSFPF